MKAQPYLCLGGIELMNAMRTETYIRRGLAGAAWSVNVEPNPAAGSGYADAYADIYTGDAYAPIDLAGYCSAIDFSTLTSTGSYVSPASDDAPWYQASRPESGEYLGLLLRDLQLPPALARTVQAAGPVGAALGRLSTRQRIVAVSAMMFASSERGMAYGERWLADALAGNQCDQLSDLTDLVLLPSCAGGFRTMKGVGLIDGPVFTELGHDESIPSCSAQQVDFQFAAELPWLLADPVVLARANLDAVGPSASTLASTDAWVGDAALRITLESTNALSATITLTPLPAGSACPTLGLNPVLTAHVAAIPTGNQLVWDSASRTLLEWDTTAKRWVSGFPLLSVEDGFAWLDVPPCSNVCVQVTAGAGSAGTVTVEQTNREL